MFSISPIDDRNYNLFAILVNVRNGTWGKKVKFISGPRGLPKDVSRYVKLESKRWGIDGHSHSWILLKELEDFDWKQKIHHKAYVSSKQAKKFKERGKIPRSYAAYSTCGKVIEWDSNYYDSFAKSFVDKIIPQLKKLEKFGEVRIVFWFDN